MTVSQRSTGSMMLKPIDLAFRPNADGAPHRLGQQPMALEHVLQPLLEQQVERLAQAVQQMFGRRAGIFPVVLLALPVGPVPIGRAQPSRFMHLARAIIGGDKAQARRRHQALLRARHRDVDAPIVHVKRHAADAAAIDRSCFARRASAVQSRVVKGGVRRETRQGFTRCSRHDDLNRDPVVHSPGPTRSARQHDRGCSMETLDQRALRSGRRRLATPITR